MYFLEGIRKIEIKLGSNLDIICCLVAIYDIFPFLLTGRVSGTAVPETKVESYNRREV